MTFHSNLFILTRGTIREEEVPLYLGTQTEIIPEGSISESGTKERSGGKKRSSIRPN